MADICTTGLWVDMKTGRVVDSEPEEGRLLVSPGGQLTPSVQADINQARAAAPPETTTEPEGDVETADEPEADQTATEPEVQTTAQSTKRAGR